MVRHQTYVNNEVLNVSNICIHISIELSGKSNKKIINTTSQHSSVVGNVNGNASTHLDTEEVVMVEAVEKTKGIYKSIIVRF